MTIEGIPEGWELVRVGKPKIGEFFIDGHGETIQAFGEHVLGCAIIRKIEKPKQYRPFANAAEFKPHRDRWLTKLHSNGRASDGCFRVDSYDDFGVWVGSERLSFDDMFNANQQFDDDSPFGVEVAS